MSSSILGPSQIYNEKRNQFEIKKNSPKELVEKVASDIEKLLAKKRKALEGETCADSSDVFIVLRGWGQQPVNIRLSVMAVTRRGLPSDE
ncbi:UNVERIFIED_CONTAM: hypothetical protein FKN15_078406 [Acipenser sinensis]